MLNLSEGLTTMATGMGTVFAFLIILWISVSLMGGIVAKLNEIFPESVVAVKTAAKKISDDVEIAIAIAMTRLNK